MSAWSELRTLLDFAVLEPVQEEVNILPFLFSFSGIYKPSTGSYTMDQNTTAMIIASQNQDYVDEGLAEYQDQIHKLQSKFIIERKSSKMIKITNKPKIRERMFTS